LRLHQENRTRAQPLAERFRLRCRNNRNVTPDRFHQPREVTLFTLVQSEIWLVNEE
jgi:hypothetical protein